MTVFFRASLICPGVVCAHIQSPMRCVRLIDLAFGGCVPVSQKDGSGRKDLSPEGVKTKGRIEAIERQKVEGQAQLTAMKIMSGVGVVEPQIAMRQKDGLMEMMPNQQVPKGRSVDKVSPAFIPVNIPVNVRHHPK